MANPLSRARWLQLFHGPRKQTFCLVLFWVRKPPRGRREAEQAWPSVGRAAEWSWCHSGPHTHTHTPFPCPHQGVSSAATAERCSHVQSPSFPQSLPPAHLPSRGQQENSNMRLFSNHIVEKSTVQSIALKTFVRVQSHFIFRFRL